MDIQLITISFWLAILSALLALSFIFSGSEVAFFSLSPKTLERTDIPLNEVRTIQSLLRDQARLLSAILIGNTIVNSFASAIFTMIFAGLVEAMNISELALTILEIGLFTFVLLIVGEITPKLIALNKPLYFARRFVKVIKFVDRVLGWFVIVLKWSEKLLPLDNLYRHHGTALFDEISSILMQVKKELVIEEEEVELIDRILDLIRDRSVESIMMPLSDVRFVEPDATIKKALSVMRVADIDFVLIYEGSPDNIIGIVTPKRIIRQSNWTPDTPVIEVKGTPLVVPSSIDISSLWRLIRDREEKVAIVVDEYGNTSGIVCLRGLLEHFIFGESGVKPISKNVVIVDGDVFLSRLEFLWGLDFGEEMSIAGFIMDKLSRIPHEGEAFDFKDKHGVPVRFEVLSEVNGRIGKVKVELIKDRK